jgi:putative thioredoxin
LYLGCCLALSGEYRAALDELLAVVRADRNFQEGAAKEAMLRIFAIAGPASDLTREYRRLLSRELYV